MPKFVSLFLWSTSRHNLHILLLSQSVSRKLQRWLAPSRWTRMAWWIQKPTPDLHCMLEWYPARNWWPHVPTQLYISINHASQIGPNITYEVHRPHTVLCCILTHRQQVLSALGLNGWTMMNSFASPWALWQCGLSHWDPLSLFFSQIHCILAVFVLYCCCMYWCRWLGCYDSNKLQMDPVVGTTAAAWSLICHRDILGPFG